MLGADAVGPGCGLAAYGGAAVFGAMAAWAILLYIGRVELERARVLAVAVWLIAMTPPIAGFVVDVVRAPVQCESGECSDYTVWWLVIPVGWVLAALLLSGSVIWGRRRSRG
ncbi:MAG: hypothetical protein ABI305_04905 [Tepidiformaceae bacterium]